MALRRNGKSAGLAERLGLAALPFFIGRLALAQRLEALDQPMGGRRPAGRESPMRQPAPVVEQLERRRPAFLLGPQHHLRLQRPIAALDRRRRPLPAPPRRRNSAPTAVDRSARPIRGRSSASYPGRARATPTSTRRGATPPRPDCAARREGSARHREDCSTAATRKVPGRRTDRSQVTKLYSITYFGFRAARIHRPSSADGRRARLRRHGAGFPCDPVMLGRLLTIQGGRRTGPALACHPSVAWSGRHARPPARRQDGCRACTPHFRAVCYHTADG